MVFIFPSVTAKQRICRPVLVLFEDDEEELRSRKTSLQCYRVTTVVQTLRRLPGPLRDMVLAATVRTMRREVSAAEVPAPTMRQG